MNTTLSTPRTANRTSVPSEAETLARMVVSLLDENDRLERELVRTAKTVSGTWKGMVRETGEEVYRILDRLNGRLERYTEAKSLVDAASRSKLCKHLVKADREVREVSRLLPRNAHLEALWGSLDEWTEACLGLASRVNEPTGEEAGLAA